jgi:hypothetical protein
MVYGQKRYRADGEKIGTEFLRTTKENLKNSVDPQGKLLTTRVPATSRIISRIMSAIFRGLWCPLRRLLNK